MNVIIALLLFLDIFSTVPVSNGELGNNDYLIVIPRVFRAGTKMNIGVNIFGSKGCDVEVRVYDGTKNVLISQARDRFQPNEAGTLELPALEKASSTLKVESTVCGVRTKKKSVNFVTFENKVFIQIDKPIYKPGQKVLIRIISVDPKLKPAGKKISSVIIEEPNGAKIMQWKDVLMQDGFANLQLQLSEEPVLGKWLIKAIFEERTITKEIEIDQYVLPKFELEIKPPSYLALDQRRILFLICARYMYGKPVPGRLNATLCLKKYERNQNCLREYNNVTGCVEIDARELIDSATEQQYNRRYYLHIAAVFTESGTGVKVKETARSPFMIRKSKTMSFIDIAEKFKPGFPMTFKVKVSYRDGQPVTSGTVRVEVIVRHFHRDTSTRLLQKTYTVDNGTIEITLENVSHFAKRLDFMADYMSGELLIEKTSKAWYSPSLTYLKLVLPHRLPPKVGSEGSIKVMYTVPYNIRERIPFFYKMLCKGNLARSDVIWVTTNWENKNRTLIRNQNNFSYNGQTIRGMTMNEFEIKFDVTQEMVPECRILVYYVRRDKETVGDSIFFDVEDTLENQVSIEFDEQEKRPGDMTIIVIKAKPGSRIAISALDKSVFLLGETDEITKKDATEILRRQGAGRMNARDFSNCKGSLRMPLETDVSENFNNAGVVFFSSLRIFTQSCRPPLPTSAPSYDYLRPYGCFLGFRDRRFWKRSILEQHDDVKIGIRNTILGKQKKIRKFFPETWLWADFKLNDSSVIQTMEVQVPDNIKSWVANGFAMSSLYGMGISNQATLKAFQPFVVHLTMPYSVIRGERIPITVTVVNYMSSCIPVKLELSRKTRDYKVTSFHIKKLCVCADSGKSTQYEIILKNIGHVPITVKATTSSAKLCPPPTLYATDTVTRNLLVEPEGIKQQYNKGTFFCSSEQGNYGEAIELPLPTDVVPGSVLPKISIVGDIMGPALANFDGLLSMPGGCGEQNLAKFAPNIYILDYLTATNQITKKTKEDALRYITTGYQKELRYRRGEGEYSAFGSRDRKGSGMITAFLIRLYARARRHVFVDEDEIKQSVGWLKQKQKSSGCFPVNGQVFDRSLQGGVHRELIITAYTTIALLEAGFKNTTMVSNALDCILGKLDDTILNAYATSLATYTLILADHPKGGIMLSRLKNMAISLKGGQLYWSAKSTGSGASDRGTFTSVAADVETTGYALLSYLHHKEHSEDVTKIVKWLSKQRNHRGGFSSTQDTCVALQALSEVAEIYYWGNTLMNLTISAIINNRFSQEFVITDNNRLILQRSKIPRKLLPNTLTLNASGSGCAFVQVSVKYNVPAIETPSAFDLKTSVHRRDAREEEETTSCHPLRLQIEAKWLKKDVSNMAIVDVKLVSGFTVNKMSLELKLRHSKNVASCSTRSNNDETHLKRYEIDGQRVILYFNKIKAMIFSLDIIQSTVVKNAQPGVVSVYDYYDPDSQGKILYNITENDCHGKERKGCPLTPCGSHSYCTNINGSYTCQCESGYTSSNGGQSCTATECPEDWKKIDGLCFYISNDTASSWNSARDDCRERGGHLTVPTNSEMNGIVLHAIQQRNIESVWIGVYRKYERKFYEVGGDEIFYHNWEYMEPNNVGGQENCVELRNLPHFSKKGGWNDVPCNRSDLHYVCQRCL